MNKYHITTESAYKVTILADWYEVTYGAITFGVDHPSVKHPGVTESLYIRSFAPGEWKTVEWLEEA